VLTWQGQDLDQTQSLRYHVSVLIPGWLCSSFAAMLVPPLPTRPDHMLVVLRTQSFCPCFAVFAAGGPLVQGTGVTAAMRGTGTGIEEAGSGSGSETEVLEAAVIETGIETEAGATGSGTTIEGQTARGNATTEGGSIERPGYSWVYRRWQVSVCLHRHLCQPSTLALRPAVHAVAYIV
jgi:hypothetical protein